MDKNVEISLLLSFYGNILTDKQEEATALYYNEDLSLAEIAEIVGITRQGVRDNIKRAETTLYDMEDKLGLCKRFLGVKNRLSEIDNLVKSIEGYDVPEELNAKLKKIIHTIIEINDSF